MQQSLRRKGLRANQKKIKQSVNPLFLKSFKNARKVTVYYQNTFVSRRFTQIKYSADLRGFAFCENLLAFNLRKSAGNYSHQLEITFNSVLLLAAFPSSVSFDTTGLVAPNPLDVNRFASMLLLTR